MAEIPKTIVNYIIQLVGCGSSRLLGLSRQPFCEFFLLHASELYREVSL